MSKSETLDIEAYLQEVSEKTLSEYSSDELLATEEDEQSSLIIPREYQSAITTFESPLMEYIRNLQVKITHIPKEISFISSIYSLTERNIIELLDYEKGEEVKQQLFDIFHLVLTEIS